MLVATVIAFSLLGTASHLQTKVDELSALQKRDQHAEVLQRATDVGPKSRDKGWEKIVTKSALLISIDDAQRSPISAYDQELDRVKAFPHLLNRPKYRLQYERVVRSSLQACFNYVANRAREKTPAKESVVDFAECVRRGERLIDDDQTSWKTLQKISTTLWRGGDKTGAARALDQTLARQKRSQRQPVCESEHADAVVSSAFRQSHDSRQASSGRRIAFEFCEKVFREEIIHELARSPSQAVFDNACPALLRNPKAGKLLRKRCKKSQTR